MVHTMIEVKEHATYDETSHVILAPIACKMLSAGSRQETAYGSSAYRRPVVLATIPPASRGYRSRQANVFDKFIAMTDDDWITSLASTVVVTYESL